MKPSSWGSCRADAGSPRRVAATRPRLARSHNGRLDALRPPSSVRRAPFGVRGPRRQPSEKIISLTGPIRMGEQHRARAGFDGEASAKPETDQVATPFNARRALRQSILIRTYLEMQQAVAGVKTNIGLGCPDQRDAVHQRRGDVEGSPCTAQGAPLKHHALTAKIDYRNVQGNGREHARSMRYSRFILNCDRAKPQTRRARCWP